MARIKSRPTTLFAQGVGSVPMKNGYHPATTMLAPYIPAQSYVPVSHTGQSSASAPIYQQGQQVKFSADIYFEMQIAL